MFNEPLNIKGTRIMNDCESDRIIDYIITNKIPIIDCEFDKDINISDHYPFTITVEFNQNPIKETILTTDIDREKLKDPRIQQNLLIYDYKSLNSEEISLNEDYELFYNDIKNIFKDKKCLKEPPKKRRSRSYKTIKKLLIQRMKEKDMNKKKEISKIIKTEIRELKKTEFINFIKKYINYMTYKNDKDTLKWIKQISHINRGTIMGSPLRNENNEIKSDIRDRLEICKQHFSKLATKEPKLNMKPNKTINVQIKKYDIKCIKLNDYKRIEIPGIK